MKTWESLGIDVSKITGQGKTTCPKCSDSRKKYKDPCLSVNIPDGVFNCHHCGWHGSLESRVYAQPKEYGEQLSEKTLAYFNSRGISEDTLKRVKITEGKTYFPQIEKERNSIHFNYFREGNLINIKYRDGEKNFKLYKDAEMIFYNLDAIKDKENVIITEGEIDCLSYIEAGYFEVVSVPNGANRNLDYVANCFEYFRDKKKIYISVDNDEAGLILQEELVRRFGKDICYIVNLPCKDANETLLKYGKEELIFSVKEAKGLPLDDIQYLGNVRELMLHQFDNGKERGTTTYFEPLDPHFTWKKGQVTLFHGIPNMGKTTFLYFLLILKSMYDGDKWAIFSPEQYPANEFYDPLIHTFLGRNIDKKYNNRVSKEEYMRGMEFIGNHFFYVYPENNNPTPEYINDKFKETIIRHGITGCVIDPFNQLDNDMNKYGRDDLYISNFLSQEKRFSQKYDLYKIIVAHPKQIQQDATGAYRCPTYYDLHGGSMWSNKCDNLIAVHAPKWHEDKSNTTRLIDVQKIKMQQLVGLPGRVTINYSRSSNRFVNEFEQQTEAF